MKEYDAKLKAASKYEDCVRRCTHCQIGASNAKAHPTFIYKDYKNNIPADLFNNLDETLKKTLNKTNRENKKRKMGFSTSEDAVSWIFINYFLLNNKLHILQEVLHLEDEISEILMWGVPQINHNSEYANTLKYICDMLGEDKQYYTEPDIIFITKSASVFIEVKVKSGNDKQKPDKKNYEKYVLDTFYSDVESAKQSGYYELIRNWTIGNLCTEHNFKLINLAPEKLFIKENKDSDFKAFIHSLKNRHNFIQLSWESVLEKLKESDIEKWFYNELEKRIFDTVS